MTKKLSPVSTDCFRGTTFRPHGKITLSVNDNLIVYRAEGPFNAELLAALDYIESDVLKKLKNDVKNWGGIVIFEISCMAIDELFIVFGEYLKQIKNNELHPVATAYVIPPDIEGGRLMAKKYEKCYYDAGILFSIFNNEKDALVWVNSHLNNI